MWHCQGKLKIQPPKSPWQLLLFLLELAQPAWTCSIDIVSDGGFKVLSRARLSMLAYLRAFSSNANRLALHIHLVCSLDESVATCCSLSRC